MARPRTHDLERLLDVAERIATGPDPTGLTLRRLATEAGVSNGSIYHAFSSKEELLARVWLRASRRMLAAQEARIAAAVGDAPNDEVRGTEAVVAAAVGLVDFAIGHPSTARLFFMQRRDQLFSENLPPDVAGELEALQVAFTELLVGLARVRWQRGDRVAVGAIAACVVDVPGGLMQRRLLSGEPLDDQTRAQIDAACRAILALELPPPPPRGTAAPTPDKEVRP